jgi:bacterioferritin-associated ferredoxin
MLPFCSQDRCHACPDRVVCRCLQVTESEIVETLTSLTIRSLKDLRHATGAGDGCTCCHQHLHELIERHCESRPAEALLAAS